MKYLFGLLLLSITLTGKAQDSSKAIAEIIASSSTQIVKDKPFSAEAVTESVQVLADGNKITRKISTRMYRDSQGRFRRDQMPSPGGSIGSFVNTEQTIFIFDPVAGVRYFLNPSSKTTRKVKIADQPTSKENKMMIDKMEIEKRKKAEASLSQSTRIDAKPGLVLPMPIAIKTESLGVRLIEGLQAEGTRSINTIPPGAMGNDRPIEIIYERWYSKDLQLIILSKHRDPRFGEQTYRLTNINRNEPENALFLPPSVYRVTAESSLSPPKKP